MIVRARSQDGMALMVVVLAAVAIFGLIVALLSFANGGVSLSRHDQDWNAALAAAQAGVDDYLARMNQDGNYWTYNSANTGGNDAFAPSQFVPVPGASNEGRFHYDADASAFATTGVVKLTATGRLRRTTRTVQAVIRRRNFLDYLYFTDFETKDPASYVPGSPFDQYTPSDAQTNCAKHYYAGRVDATGAAPPGGPYGCTPLHFVSADVIRGPMHTNDAFRVAASATPQFLKSVTTSWNFASPSPGYLGETGASPTFENAGDPRYAPALAMPPTNARLQADADGALGGTGCLYTGPTRITPRSDGKMDVESPDTTSTNPGCGPGTGLSLPANGVVYVRSVPAGGTSTCPAHPLAYPIPLDITPYGCGDGDVFLAGVLKGRMTIGAENNIVITGDVTYEGGTGPSSGDLLGLVANSYVEIYHPVRCAVGVAASCSLPPHFSDPTVHAAILTLQHSFRVQNYAIGAPLGTLNLTGAVSQRYRGAVVTYTLLGGVLVPKTGYGKNYNYDDRLKTQAPPRFVDPVQSAWAIAAWAELKPLYGT